MDQASWLGRPSVDSTASKEIETTKSLWFEDQGWVDFLDQPKVEGVHDTDAARSI